MLPEFRNSQLLRRALTHASYANEHLLEYGAPVEDNERLEFLGDAILDFVAAAWLFQRYPDVDEGRLTMLRASLVRATTLARYAEAIGVPELLRLGRGEKDSGGRHRANILGDAFEALLGALYLDQGFDAVCQYFEPLLAQELDKILNQNLDRDAKSQLQEWSQSMLSKTPRYKLLSTDGPDHAKVFTVQVWIGDAVVAAGTGSSKQVAEQHAARKGLANLIAQQLGTPSSAGTDTPGAEALAERATEDAPPVAG